MKRTRKIELLEIVKQRLIDGNPLEQTGICYELSKLTSFGVCTNIEVSELKFFLLSNKPTKHNEFASYIDDVNWYDNYSGYWWLTINFKLETKQIRINYLTDLINKLK